MINETNTDSKIENIRYEIRTNKTDGVCYMYLNTEAVDLGYDMTEKDNYNKLKFMVDTYDNFKTEDPIRNSVILRPVNLFFSTLSKSDQSSIARALIGMNFAIISTLDGAEITIDTLVNKLAGLTDLLSMYLEKLDSGIDLFGKIKKFTVENIPITKDKVAGTRAQDSETMTFYQEHVEELTALVVLCKLLTPIFGQLIYRTKGVLDNNIKEHHCFIILNGIFNQRPDLTKLKSKLFYYIEKSINSKATLEDAVHLCTPNTSISMVEVILYVRRFISVDLFTENSKLMVYISYVSKLTFSTQRTNSQKKKHVKERSLPSEIFGGEEGNMSILENDSLCSKVPESTMFMILYAADIYFNKTVAELDIRDLMDDMYAEYLHKKIPVTDIGKYLIGVKFGNALLGAKSVDYLDYDMYLKYISLFQYVAYHKQYNALLPIMALIKSPMAKSKISEGDNLLRLHWNKTHEFNLCKEKYNFTAGVIKWCDKLESIVNNLTTDTYVQFYPESFMRHVDCDLESSVVYKIDLNVPVDICKLILDNIEE